MEKPTELTPAERERRQRAKGKPKQGPQPIPKAVISQLQVELTTSLMNDLETTRRLLRETISPIFNLLLQGCEVEPGPLIAEVRDHDTAISTAKELYVNGRRVSLM